MHSADRMTSARFVAHLYIDPLTGAGEEDLAIRYPAVSGRMGPEGPASEGAPFTEDSAWPDYMSALSESGLASVAFSPASGDFSYTLADSGARHEWTDALKTEGCFEDTFTLTLADGEGNSSDRLIVLIFINEHAMFSDSVHNALAREVSAEVHIRLNRAPERQAEAGPGFAPASGKEEPAAPWTEAGETPLFDDNPFDPNHVYAPGESPWTPRAEMSEDDIRAREEFLKMATLTNLAGDFNERAAQGLVLRDYEVLNLDDLTDGDLAVDTLLENVETLQEEGKEGGVKALILTGERWAGIADLVRGTGKYQRENDTPMRIDGMTGAFDHYTYVSRGGDTMHLYVEILLTMND